MRKVALGIDIGGTTTAVGLVADGGVILAREVVDTGGYDTFEALVEDVARRGRLMVEGMACAETEFCGVGVGAPNASSVSRAIENAPNLKWNGTLPLADELQRWFPSHRIAVTNDANAAAVGEMFYGGARGMSDFVVVTLGTGVGCGIVAGGRLVEGADGLAGEVGHVTVCGGSGRVCGCGREDCLESYLSASGIVATAVELLEQAEYRSAELARIKHGGLTTEILARAAAEGDPLAREVFERAGRVLGGVLANLAAVLSPQAVFLGGGVARAGAVLMEPVERHMRRNLMLHLRSRLAIRVAELESKNATILGVAALLGMRKS